MKHAHLIPLVGGSAIGASLALKSNPEYIASWEPFAKNDSFCRNYFKNTPWIPMETHKGKKLPKVDLITCVPPCSGLSTATPSANRGCSAPQNKHMLIVAETAMSQKTDVVIIENAPTLYSRGGEEFANRFVPLIKKYKYSMVLYKTSTILHGLPQNRVRSFVLLFRGNQVPKPEYLFIKEKYKPLYEWKPVNNSSLSKDWKPKEDEIITALKQFGGWNNRQLIQAASYHYGTNPVTAWKYFTDLKVKHRFKTEPYRYMQQTSAQGKGIMDRSPYLVWDHCNALMWKSAHKMLNPAEPSRQFNIRELMNLMGLPKDFPEIPAKDINVLFQNVPVTTVKTLVEKIEDCFECGSGSWTKSKIDINRYDNIKQISEIFE